jgi:hypothetical protein
MVTANALGLIGPIALLAALGLNGLLLGRSVPAFARALGGVRPQMVPAFAPDGESNVIPFPAARRQPVNAARRVALRAA